MGTMQLVALTHSTTICAGFSVMQAKTYPHPWLKAAFSKTQGTIILQRKEDDMWDENQDLRCLHGNRHFLLKD